jgi:surface-anchored protein
MTYGSDGPYKLQIQLEESTGGITYDSGSAVIQSAASAEWTLPDGTPLGNEGDSIWILPQNPDPALPFLGLNTEAIPAGLFEGPLQYALIAVDGPGDFFLWQAGTGGFDVQMDTTDGIGAGDLAELPSGGHAHHNWGFTQPGLYGITLQARGQRIGVETNDFSAETTLTFHVEPLPAPPRFTTWRRTHWPVWVDDAIKGPGADPDMDGVANAMEYALGLNPLVTSRSGLPEFSWVQEGEQTYPGLTVTRVKAAPDIEYLPRSASSLTSNDWQLLTEVVTTVDNGETETVTYRDVIATEGTVRRFYQLQVSLVGF